MKKLKELLLGTSFIWLPITGILLAGLIIKVIGG